MSKRRCPEHPTGCPKHPNPNPPRPTLPVQLKRLLGRSRTRRRGSIERYVAIQHTAGSGNPARRRWLVPRASWEAGRG